jgi:hypothetical protein
MPSVTIKRNVLLRSIVTEKLRTDLSEELQSAADEVDQRVQQLDFQTRAYITDLQRTNLQQAMAVRKQVEAEKHRQQELRDALLERKAQVEVLEDGSEVVRGTLESFVEINVGDDLSEVLGGVEIVTKDDVVVEIRQRQTTDEPEESVTQIIQDVRSQSGQ